MNELKKILFISASWEKGGAEAVFRFTLDICSDYYDTDYYFPKGGFISSLIQLWKQLKYFKPDIVHIHNYHTPFVLLITSFLKKRFREYKIIHTAHDHRFLCPESYYGKYVNGMFFPYKIPPSNWDKIIHCYSNKNLFIDFTKKIKWFFWFRLLYIQRKMDIIFTPSEYLQKQMRMDRGCANMNIQLLRNPAEFHDASDAHKVKTSLKLKMVFIGRLSFEKGLIELMHLLKEVKKIDYSLDIYGEGYQLPLLESEVEKLRLENRVRLRGFLNSKHVNDTLKKYDVLVLPSICNENAPLVLVEGSIAGLRLLSVGYGGAAELAKLCEGYHLFDPRSAKSFLCALNECNQQLALGRTNTAQKTAYLKGIFGRKKYIEVFQREINKF